MNYIELNNQVIIRDENGKYQLDKDKEALKSYLEDYIEPKMKKFDNLNDRLNYLVENFVVEEKNTNSLKEIFQNLFENKEISNDNMTKEEIKEEVKKEIIEDIKEEVNEIVENQGDKIVKKD